MQNLPEVERRHHKVFDSANTSHINSVTNTALIPVQSHDSIPPHVFLPTAGISSQAVAATLPSITINFSGTAHPSVSSTSLAHTLMNPALPSLLPMSAEHDVPKYQGQPMTSSQLLKWNELLVRFGDTRISNHQWEWKHGEFLPFYIYQPVDQFMDYWIEWTEGLGGCLSTRELTEMWGAKWRRNNGGQRTECGRRKKVTDLISVLSARPNWDVNLTLRFLSGKYHLTPRKFSDWLTPANVLSVHAAAASYC